MALFNVERHNKTTAAKNTVRLRDLKVLRESIQIDYGLLGLYGGVKTGYNHRLLWAGHQLTSRSNHLIRAPSWTWFE
jgi:hypothetical protein